MRAPLPKPCTTSSLFILPLPPSPHLHLCAYPPHSLSYFPPPLVLPTYCHQHISSLSNQCAPSCHRTEGASTSRCRRTEGAHHRWRLRAEGANQSRPDDCSSCLHYPHRCPYSLSPPLHPTIQFPPDHPLSTTHQQPTPPPSHSFPRTPSPEPTPVIPHYPCPASTQPPHRRSTHA